MPDPRMSRLGKLVLVICITIAAVCVLGGVWWWALFGLSEEVGMALGVTALLAFVGLVFAHLIPEPDRQRADGPAEPT